MSIRSRELTTDTAYTTFFKDLMLEKRTAIPGIIRKINLDGGALVSVDVQPAIGLKIADKTGRQSTDEALPIIPSIPVVLPYAQKLGLSITIPISVGDDCLLIFGDRAIDNWQFDGGLQSPVETTVPRTHDLTDAICIPGIGNNVTAIADYKFDAIEVRNSDRTFYSKLNSSVIEHKTPSATTTLTSSEITHVVGSSSIVMDSSSITISATTVTINGTNLNVDSTDTTFSGTITDGNGVSVEGHIHVDSVGGDTSTPMN